MPGTQRSCAIRSRRCWLTPASNTTRRAGARIRLRCFSAKTERRTRWTRRDTCSCILTVARKWTRRRRRFCSIRRASRWRPPLGAACSSLRRDRARRCGDRRRKARCCSPPEVRARPPACGMRSSAEDVRFDEQATGRESDARGRVERQVEARTLNVDFAREAGGHGVEARKAIADGSPVVTMRQMPARGRGHSMRISGDHLVATLASGNRLRTLDGTGNTQVLDESSDGAKTRRTAMCCTRHLRRGRRRWSRSDLRCSRSVRKTERQGTGTGRGQRRGAVRTSLETAVQDGHVVLTETPAPGNQGKARHRPH